jgi:anti-sigma factor RsiW
MDCLKAEEQFSAYLEDMLDYRAIKAFETHLADCQRCRRELALFRESLHLLHESPQVQASPEFDLNLQIRLADAQVESIPFRRQVLSAFRLQPAWAFSGIVALFILLAGVYMYQNVFIKPSPVVDARSDAPSIHIRHVPVAEIKPDDLLRQQPPLAIPNLPSQLSFRTAKSPAYNLQFQQPQRIERNYILQTVNYTRSSVGGGL